ncbi:hypothetical protein [Burkholderia lata]|uniref:Uncharacterized protein n=1 Tax=Burkholderia lata (strain ATCC 17760 / DSM 23089 / LMG 22485 / NCIMB 9086 / R18194 / 383) TaxID=482957 RepID=Q39G85_BURL3|nr:hypothetical protein [Burkholderia lata]ABB08531.1 hypothetical protein Bcep18194_A4936 [Burkholderia lata]
MLFGDAIAEFMPSALPASRSAVEMSRQRRSALAIAIALLVDVLHQVFAARVIEIDVDMVPTNDLPKKIASSCRLLSIVEKVESLASPGLLVNPSVLFDLGFGMFISKYFTTNCNESQSAIR